MGIDYKVYVGPYIEVYNPLKDSTEEYHTCPNKKCEKYKSKIGDKFCSVCGSKIKLVTFPCKESISFDVYEEFEGEPLSQALSESNQKEYREYKFYVPNLKGSPGRSFDPVGDCGI